MIRIRISIPLYDGTRRIKLTYSFQVLFQIFGYFPARALIGCAKQRNQMSAGARPNGSHPIQFTVIFTRPGIRDGLSSPVCILRHGNRLRVLPAVLTEIPFEIEQAWVKFAKGRDVRIITLAVEEV